MRVSVIIPAWNNWEYTVNCLTSLARHDAEDLEIVVVDNGSTDATRDALAPFGDKFFGSRFVRVRQDNNLGFAMGCNAGVSAGSGDVLFFLNNDTTVTENWLAPLVQALDRPNTIAVGPLLLYPDGTCQHCGVSFTPLRKPVHFYANVPGSFHALRTPHHLQAITGAALMVRRQDFLAIGGFHADYRNGFEDLDVCYALRQRGGQLAIVPDSVIMHHESKTVGRHKDEQHNAELFTRRWGDAIRPDLHKQVAVDGYVVHLNHLLIAYTALTESHSLTMEKRVREGDIEHLQTLLVEEPLWLAGHLKLIRWLEQTGKYEQALIASSKATRLFPLDVCFRAVLRNAKRLHNKDVGRVALAQLHRDPEKLRECRQNAVFYRKLATTWNDSMLMDVFDRWLATYGK